MLALRRFTLDIFLVGFSKSENDVGNHAHYHGANSKGYDHQTVKEFPDCYPVDESVVRFLSECRKDIDGKERYNKCCGEK
jgi:hypothetical protein